MSLSFKVDPRLKTALEDLAKKENRSLSNYVITFLMKHLEDQGIDWKKVKTGKQLMLHQRQDADGGLLSFNQPTWCWIPNREVRGHLNV